MNVPIQSVFNSFLAPYQNLNSGTSCSFLTYSLNTVSDTACNKNFPYIHALTILTIAISGIVFILMILAYFMATRLEYFQFLDGDWSNYRPQGEP